MSPLPTDSPEGGLAPQPSQPEAELATEAAHDISPQEHRRYMKEREGLIDAARESARTFDKAVLAFGSAVFGASDAFLKDVAPHPRGETLGWLAASWALFSVGLTFSLISFLTSHQACMFEIEEGERALGKPKYNRRCNGWSTATDSANVLCVTLLFAGILCWTTFALKNLNEGDDMKTPPPPPPRPERIEKGYTPPRTPPPPPRNPPQPPPPPKK